MKMFAMAAAAAMTVSGLTVSFATPAAAQRFDHHRGVDRHQGMRNRHHQRVRTVCTMRHHRRVCRTVR